MGNSKRWDGSAYQEEVTTPAVAWQLRGGIFVCSVLLFEAGCFPD